MMFAQNMKSNMQVINSNREVETGNYTSNDVKVPIYYINIIEYSDFNAAIKYVQLCTGTTREV